MYLANFRNYVVHTKLPIIVKRVERFQKLCIPYYV